MLHVSGRFYLRYPLNGTPSAIQGRTRPAVPKLCSADPKEFATGSQGIRGCIYVMATVKFTYFLIKEITFC